MNRREAPQARLCAAPYGAKVEAKLNERSEDNRTEVRRPAPGVGAAGGDGAKRQRANK